MALSISARRWRAASVGFGGDSGRGARAAVVTEGAEKLARLLVAAMGGVDGAETVGSAAIPSQHCGTESDCTGLESLRVGLCSSMVASDVVARLLPRRACILPRCSAVLAALMGVDKAEETVGSAAAPSQYGAAASDCVGLASLCVGLCSSIVSSEVVARLLTRRPSILPRKSAVRGT